MCMKKLFGAILALVAFSALGAFVVTQAWHIGYNQGYQPDQPIAFSHAKHAGELNIDCKYCHFGADKSRHAGIPPTQLCLNCHAKVKVNSPEIMKVQKAVDSGENIHWKKVNYYPDYAYFNHAQHVNVAGFACQKCHGPVEEMEVYWQEKKLGMGWCISCHRENGIAAPEDDVHSGKEGAFKGSVQGKSRAGGDCSKCHY